MSRGKIQRENRAHSLKERISKQRLSPREQALFAKRLSFLIRANVPILDSLNIIHRQTKSKKKRAMLSRIIDAVTSGQFLAASLEEFDKTFSDFAINIIKTGETSGTLDESLQYLAEELEKKQKLRRKVFSSLLYPALIVLATISIVALLVTYVFPKVLPVFASLNTQLPLSTKTLIWLINFLITQGLWIATGIALLVALCIWAVTTKENAHYVWDCITLKTPLFRQLTLNYQIANLARTIGLLLKADMGAVHAFTVAASTTANIAYRRALKAAASNIAQGEQISSQLAKQPLLFPDIFVEVVAIGEQTGQLSDAFTYLSNFYEEELESATKNLSSALEPTLMIALGIIVGFIAISIITPIYEVTQNLNP